jgi:hypothetical protein
LNLYKLFTLVELEGGHAQVDLKGLWRELYTRLTNSGVGKVPPSADKVMKTAYEKCVAAGRGVRLWLWCAVVAVVCGGTVVCGGSCGMWWWLLCAYSERFTGLVAKGLAVCRRHKLASPWRLLPPQKCHIL